MSAARPMDNPYYGWSPLSNRPALRWPGSARVAFSLVLILEKPGWYPAPGSIVPSQLRQSRAYPAQPDIHHTSPYDYGNRVGVFRVLNVLARHGIRPMVAMDADLAACTPYLVQRLVDAGAEFLGHGRSAEQLINESMTEQEEAALIDGTLDDLTAAVGRRPTGWLGSEYGESSRTVALLAARGVDHVLDWPTDEQPHPMAVPTGRMTNLPAMVELDDALTLAGRGLSVARFSRMIVEQFDRLYEDGRQSGRLFILPVRPWIMGQPFRIKYLDAALAHITAREDVWSTTGRAIVDWYAEVTAVHSPA
jgi:peptidoglycan/xylan/chitin deacetylase (PgdA/CDA1 family)